MLRITVLAVLLFFSGCSKSSPERNLNEKEQPNQVADTQATEKTEPQSVVRQQSSGNLPYYLIGLVIVVGGFLLYKKYENNKRRIKQVKDNLRRVDENIQSLNRKLNNQQKFAKTYKRHKDKIESKLERLKKDISHIKVNQSGDISNINSKIGSREQEKKENESSQRSELEDDKDFAESFVKKKEQDVLKSNQQEKSLFFSVPSPDGEFVHAKGQEEYESRKLYKIIYQEGESDGTIEYVSGKYDGHAINHKDSILKPVCNIQEATEQNPTSINMLEPGKVRLNGNEWVIQDKLKVEII